MRITLHDECLGQIESRIFFRFVFICATLVRFFVLLFYLCICVYMFHIHDSMEYKIMMLYTYGHIFQEYRCCVCKLCKSFIRFAPVRSVHTGRNKFLIFPQCLLNIISFRPKRKPSRNIVLNHILSFFGGGLIFPLVNSRVGTIHLVLFSLRCYPHFFV